LVRCGVVPQMRRPPCWQQHLLRHHPEHPDFIHMLEPFTRLTFAASRLLLRRPTSAPPPRAPEG